MELTGIARAESVMKLLYRVENSCIKKGLSEPSGRFGHSHLSFLRERKLESKTEGASIDVFQPTTVRVGSHPLPLSRRFRSRVPICPHQICLSNESIWDSATYPTAASTTSVYLTVRPPHSTLGSRPSKTYSIMSTKSVWEASRAISPIISALIRSSAFIDLPFIRYGDRVALLTAPPLRSRMRPRSCDRGSGRRSLRAENHGTSSMGTGVPVRADSVTVLPTALTC